MGMWYESILALDLLPDALLRRAIRGRMRRQTPLKNLGFFWGVLRGKWSRMTFSTDS